MSDEQQQHWFAGLPVTGSRTLTDDEIRELNARLNRPAMPRKSMVALLAAAAAVLLIAMYAGYLHDLPRLINIAIAIAVTAAFSNKVRNDQAARHDVATGHVLVCSGEARQLVSALGEPVGDAPITIEVLPRSAMLWTIDGRRVPKWRKVHRSTTMAIPQHARMAANFVRPVEGVDDLLAHQRLLSDAEVAEVIGITPRLPIRMLLGTSALLVLAIFFTVVGAREQLLGMRVMAVIIAAIAAFFIVRLVRFIRFRQTLRRDIRDRTVIIVRRREDDVLGPASEFLAHTNIPWTGGGEPVAWRKLRG